MIKIEAEKVLKYENLTIEIRRMGNVQAKVIPVITGASGTISESRRRYLGNVPGKNEIKELQTTAILALREVQM